MATEFKGQTSYITTHNGNIITFDDIRPEMLKASEFAWHLARVCRYNGMLLRWYSNAEHSVLGMQYCKSLQAKRRFLIHDAGELLTGDVPSPFKRRCPDYDRECRKIQLQVNELLCPIKDGLENKAIEDEVHYADLRVTAAEQKFMRSQSVESYVAEPPDTFQWYNWDWPEAYTNWLNTFKQLFPEWKY